MKNVAGKLEWHLFCRVVDNYGDIGFCWRLARQLAAEHGINLTLWVDDLVSLQAIQPDIDPGLDVQECALVSVRFWPAVFPVVSADQVGDVVIEAFGCDIPESYLKAMQIRRPLWINLEYLSAEPWVRQCHLAPSPLLGLRKVFFYPGFEQGTGGLLWDDTVLSLGNCHGEPFSMDQWQQTVGIHVPTASRFHVSLFAYENPALNELLEFFSGVSDGVHVWVPQGRILADVQHWAGQRLLPGQSLQRDHLTVTVLPFLPQASYFHLLALCDVNLVRGEDSFVVAQMLSRPLLWQIYSQQDDAHLVKLAAFLNVYLQGLAEEDVQLWHRILSGWNGNGRLTRSDLQAFWDRLPQWQQHAVQWRQHLVELGDLATNLMAWVTRQTRG